MRRRTVRLKAAATRKSAAGVAVCHVPGLQSLMDHICRNGFEHHVAMCRGHHARPLAEACGRYLGWDVYHHQPAAA